MLKTQFMLQMCSNIAFVKRGFTVPVVLIKTFYLRGTNIVHSLLRNDTGKEHPSPISRLPTDAETAKRRQPKSLSKSAAIS